MKKKRNQIRKEIIKTELYQLGTLSDSSTGPPGFWLWRSESPQGRLWAHAEWEPYWVLLKCQVSLKAERQNVCQMHGDHDSNHDDDDGKYRTLDNLVVGEVQVEQEQHVQQSQSPAEQQPRGLAHCAGQQNRHLMGGHSR